jgi:hypothetical protein
MRVLSLCVLLGAGFAQAVQVYLSPSLTLPPNPSIEHATLAISHHLGLELSQPLGHYSDYFGGEQSFVGEGPSSALLLAIDEVTAHGALFFFFKKKKFVRSKGCPNPGLLDVLPESLQVSFTLPDDPTLISPSSVISTYLHWAPHVYLSIFTALSVPPTTTPRVLDLFSISSPSLELFLSEMSTLFTFIDDPSISKFGALELKGLYSIAQTYGHTSEQYDLAVRATRALLDAALANSNALKLALITFPVYELHERQVEQPPQSPLPAPVPPPQQPIGSISTCYATADECNQSTDTCSGHGHCVEASKAGRTCFVCVCGTTLSPKGKNETWAGEKCEKKDISG